jgi:hypothetical protein
MLDAEALEEGLVIVLDELGGAGHQADFLSGAILHEFLQGLSQELLLLLCGGEAVAFGLGAGQQGQIPLLFVRLGPEEGDEALKEPYVSEFNITGRSMKGWVLVAPQGVKDDDQLKGWVQRAVKFVGKLPAK